MNQVTLANYQSFGSGPGMGTQSDIAELMKAMEASHLTGRDTTGLLDASGAPLKVESLENTLHILTNTERDVPMWKKISKLAAYNTVEEYNQLLSYGVDGGVFTNEGELPKTDDAVYRRNSVLVKYMGTTREVTHQMQLVQTMVGNMIQQETKNGTQYLMRQADGALAYANSANVPQEWDGLYAMHRGSFTNTNDYFNSEVVIDAKGKMLSDDLIEDAAYGIDKNFGFMDTIVGPPIVFANYVKNFLSKKLISPNTTQVTAGLMGQRVTQIQTQFGLLDIVDDKFWRRSQVRSLTDPATNAQAPNAPVADGTAPTAVTTAVTSRFMAGDVGTYTYAVSAVNRYGESPLTTLGDVAIANVGEVVDLKFTDGGGAVSATAYKIYRTAVSSTNGALYPVMTVPVAALTVGYEGAAAGLARDNNYVMAGTEECFIYEQSPQIVAFKQLAPLMKMNLAVLAPSTRFMILLYGAPVLYAPRKVARITNIGTLAA